MSELLELGAIELSDGVDRGDFTYVDIMEACLDRVDAVNAEVNAIVSLRDRETLLKEAKAAAMQPKASKLHGLPIAVKDLLETKGIRTTHGSPVFADYLPEKDALAARRMREAGLIFIGKTNTPEFGLGSHSYNPVHGVTRNPYNLERTAGGSSGGAAAALATRMIPVADGSDMMGSLRNPAAWCNVYGLRPTFGLVTDDPIGELFLHPLATLGPMARSIDDLALLLDVLSGPQAGNPFCLPQQSSFLTALGTPCEKAKIGWLGDWNGHYQIEGDILEVSENGLKTFEALGHSVEPLQLEFDPKALWMSWVRLRNFAVASRLRPVYENKEWRAKLKPEAIYEIEAGLALSGNEIAEASLVRSQWFAYLAELYGTYDAIVLPSAQVMPFDAERHWPDEINGQQMTTYHQWMEIVIPASLVGLPALNLPAGFSTTGLPVGFQLIGARASDAKLLRLGKAYHEATLWPQKNPSGLIST
ncbi:MAG: amidase [Rhizobiaceae bacterium]|nr:amidase [Rhizobiaceae bacterium]